ncbi:MAG: RluA family pseudouridine synthase [Anaerolineae bacterium]|nr:RluA family pseudouridine synthase [Anaerolineae bacterium]
MLPFERALVEARMRLDQFLVRTWTGLDRRSVREKVRAGQVLVNGQPATKAGQYVEVDDEVSVSGVPVDVVAGTEPSSLDVSVPALPLSVLYEDEAVLVVEKLAGVPVHLSSRSVHQQFQQTLAGKLSALYPLLAHVGGADRAGIVMRVEAEVSGAVLVAKDEDTYHQLQRNVKHDQVERIYSALVEGRLTGQYVIDQPIGNVKRARQRLAVAREGRPARTAYRGQQHYKDEKRDYSLLEVQPQTARLHQIRVHLSWYGFPLVGDRVYGSRQQPLLPDRIFLHLSVVTFPHPITGDLVRVESALAPELRSVLRYLTRPKG